RVGLAALQACTASTKDEACTQNSEIIAALVADEYVTVAGFEKGVLNCKSLRQAENAPELRLNLTNSEEVTAKIKSFRVTSGNAFSDNVNRMVWTGEVVEAGGGFGGIPRSISMSWDDCDVEHFMLRVKTPQHDGTTRVTTTLPCTDPSEPKQVCLLQLVHAAEEESLETLATFEEPEQAHHQGHRRQHDGEEHDDNRDADGNLRRSRSRRHLRKQTSSDDNDGTTGNKYDGGSSRSEGKGQTSKSRRGARRSRKTSEVQRRRLAMEVSEGMEAKRARDPDIDAKDEDVRLLNEYLVASAPEQEVFHERGVRRLSSAEVQMPSGRVLTATTEIDVMVLYTPAAMISSGTAGTLLTNQQMETEIITAYATANDALADSGISAAINVVHQADFVEGLDMNSDLSYIAKDEIFDSLRTEYGADLVQMIGYYEDSCGTGYVMATPRAAFEGFGYSIVHTHCLDNLSHIHEIGHNMGANHNREDTSSEHDYAHAQRYCTGDAPYRTIMAYETGCLQAPRVAMFSTQDKTYASKSLGTTSTDNARVIEESLSTVVNFRDRNEVAYDRASSKTPSPQQQQQQQKQQEEGRQQQQGAPTPTSHTDSSNGEYQGCYRHSWSELELANVPLVDYEHTSPEGCQEHCKAASFAYYALEFGSMCSCGDRFPSNSSLATSADCALPCPNSSLTSLTCGGNWHHAVFSVSHGA
ncbi:unnamed protein product, partial [Ectocarpus sp. 12 AP-2014]